QDPPTHRRRSTRPAARRAEALVRRDRTTHGALGLEHRRLRQLVPQRGGPQSHAVAGFDHPISSCHPQRRCDRVPPAPCSPSPRRAKLSRRPRSSPDACRTLFPFRSTRSHPLARHLIMSRTDASASSAPSRTRTRSRARAALFSPPEPHTRLRPRSVGGVHLNVEVHGPDDAPTVVLIHGWTCSVPFWAPVISTLREDLRVVAYDLRGHGASDLPGRGQYS